MRLGMAREEPFFGAFRIFHDDDAKMEASSVESFPYVVQQMSFSKLDRYWRRLEDSECLFTG